MIITYTFLPNILLRVTPTAKRNTYSVATPYYIYTQGSVLRPQPWAGKSQLLQSCRWVRTVPPLGHLCPLKLLQPTPRSALSSPCLLQHTPTPAPSSPTPTPTHNSTHTIIPMHTPTHNSTHTIIPTPTPTHNSTHTIIPTPTPTHNSTRTIIPTPTPHRMGESDCLIPTKMGMKKMGEMILYI